MQVNLTVDVKGLEGRVRNAPKRIAFAVVNALNETAKVAQQAVRHQVSDTFTVRKPGFVLQQAAIIKPFASVGKGRAFVDISVGQKNRLLLPLYERGAARLPFKGRSVAVPITGGARPNNGASVPPELFVQALRLRRPKATTKEARKGRRKGLVGKTWQGEQGTYLLPGVGIFQRQGGERKARILYAFKTGLQLKPQLHFVETVDQVAQRVFPQLLRAEVQKALEFKR